MNVALDASAYERPDNSPMQLDGTSLYVQVRRKPSRIDGQVLDESGRPVAGVTVSVAGISTRSTAQGRFDLVLPSDQVLDGMVMRASANGYQPWSQLVVPDGGSVTAVLRR